MGKFPYDERMQIPQSKKHWYALNAWTFNLDTWGGNLITNNYKLPFFTSFELSSFLFVYFENNTKIYAIIKQWATMNKVFEN
jgi:hypothetical protein